MLFNNQGGLVASKSDPVIALNFEPCQLVFCLKLFKFPALDLDQLFSANVFQSGPIERAFQQLKLNNITLLHNMAVNPHLLYFTFEHAVIGRINVFSP